MKRALFPLGVMILMVVFSMLGVREVWSANTVAGELPPTPGAESGIGTATTQAVQEAIEAAMVAHKEDVLAYLVYQTRVDQVVLSEDGNWAYAYLVLKDDRSGDILPSEPGLAIARLENKGWVVALPSDENWLDWLVSAPNDLISLELKQVWVEMFTAAQAAQPTTALSGYLLPWKGGESVYLSRSVAHDKDIPSGSAHYAFDFYIHDTMWNIYAAKSGTVWMFKTDVPTCYDYHCDQPLGNYIVLQDTSTTPTTYQLYLHMAEDSIPPELRVVGAAVARGQFIGISDNTGQSYGHHLHFMVHTNPASYWGTSVDITFDDVSINGGRPRRHDDVYDDFPYCTRSDDVCITGQASYVSGNYLSDDMTPPYGGLLGVSTGNVIKSSTLSLGGWGADDKTGLDYGQLITDYGGEWHNLGDPFSSNFVYTWDLCAANAAVPDGPVSLALRLYDKAGNWTPLAGLTHITKQYACPQPPPACVPTIDQVALFEDVDYGGGCAVFDIGEYQNGPALTGIGGDKVESILVGQNVIVTVYSGSNYSGHSEAFTADDSYLADNVIGANSISSVRVAMHSNLPSTPSSISPSSGQTYEEGDVIGLSWRNGGGATEYEVQITPTSPAFTPTWQTAPFVYLDLLPEGSYSWHVTGRNSVGESLASPEVTFTVGAASTPPATVNAPFSDGFESEQDRWTGTGLWRLVNDSGMAHAGSSSWWYQESNGNYDNGVANFGSLTSPPISIPSSGYYLRFYYRYETESQYQWWDQRWVQISVDGGQFENWFQLGEDPQIPDWSSWLQSTAKDLSAYSGHIIRVRFVFNTLDEASNDFSGWGIDDFSVTHTAPTNCSDTRQDDTYQQAMLLEYNPLNVISGAICPGGDVDYYKFEGKKGDRIVIDVDAKDYGSSLDPYLVFYDQDGTSILAERDDEELGVRRDPRLGFILPQDGTYYFKLRAFDNPSVGGNAYDYSFRLYTDADFPTIQLTYPLTGDFLPNEVININAQVEDASDDMSHVDFYYHSSYWQTAAWIYLGSDWDGSDGWSYELDPSSLSEGVGLAIYAYATDKADNVASVGAWNLGIDRTAPQTEMLPISATQESTAFLLKWSGSDNLSGLDHYDIQSSEDGGGWQDASGTLSGHLTQAWFVGSPGHSYAFRMRGTDLSGNAEAYPSVAEVSTTIPGASVLCSSLDVYDKDGNDNSSSTASVIFINGSEQEHNFCNPLAADFTNDEDWVSFNVHQGHRYFIQALALSIQTAVRLSLYDNVGNTLLPEVSPQVFGKGTSFEWVASLDGTVYLRMRHLDGKVIGSTVKYLLRVQEGYWLYIPLAER